MNYKEVKCKWTSPAAPPSGIELDTIYSIIKKNNKLHITNQNLELPFDQFCITTFMTAQNIDSWNDVDFEDLKPIETTKEIPIQKSKFSKRK